MWGAIQEQTAPELSEVGGAEGEVNDEWVKAGDRSEARMTIESAFEMCCTYHRRYHGLSAPRGRDKRDAACTCWTCWFIFYARRGLAMSAVTTRATGLYFRKVKL